jgi:hypothetical protein
MKNLFNLRSGVLLAAGFAAGVLLSGTSVPLSETFVSRARAEQKMPTKASDAANVPPDLQELSGHLPDQAHAMTDVGYHFANLWFAADKQNWPLAGYYFAETRSHLQWAVRIHPVRKTSAGADVNLKGILDAVDGGLLAEVGRSITNKDVAKFKMAYRETLKGCYACHQACEKPFLRPQVPSAPAASILNFDPDATSPE